MRKAKTYLLGGLLLSFLSLLLRFMDVGFNIYIHSEIGAEKLGLYALIMSVYSLGITFASSGIYMTCTRLVADSLALHHGKEAKKALFGCMAYSLFFGISGGILLFSLSKFLGFSVLKEEEAVSAFRVLSLSLPALSLSSCFSGYFTAVRRVYKSGLLSLGTQIFKIAFTVLLFRVLLPKGRGVSALVYASVIAEVLSALLLLLLILPDMKKHIPKEGPVEKGMQKRIVKIALPIAFTAWVRSALLSGEHILIPKGLEQFGEAEALSTYGTLHALAFPVIFFPSAILSAFTSLFMPEISRFKVKKEQKEISVSASRMLRITLLFSIACSGVLFFFGKEVGILLYSSVDAGKMIALFAPLIPVMYIDTAVDSVLKGLGEQVYSMKVNIADAFLSLVLVYFLVPKFGLAGYVFTVFLSECFNAFFSLKKLISLVFLDISPYYSVILPIFSMVLSALLFYKMSFLPLLLQIVLTLLLYFVFLFFTGAFLKSDRRYFRRLLFRSAHQPV